MDLNLIDQESELIYTMEPNVAIKALLEFQA